MHVFTHEMYLFILCFVPCLSTMHVCILSFPSLIQYCIHVGKSKKFGFVDYADHESAMKAVEALNGKTYEEEEPFQLYVGKMQKKSERSRELKVTYFTVSCVCCLICLYVFVYN